MHRKSAARASRTISPCPFRASADFLTQAEAAVLQRMPGTRIVAFGHLGDGNLHYNLSATREHVAGQRSWITGKNSLGW